jgi:4-hydroxybenzoate polyprenyltransferase
MAGNVSRTDFNPFESSECRSTDCTPSERNKFHSTEERKKFRFTGLKLLELVRFSHTLFALPFALLAAVMAWTVPPPVPSTNDESAHFRGFRVLQLVGILLCMVCARNVAMAFNRIADRHIDAANPRTRNRHLPSGSLSLPTVYGFAMLNMLGFILATLLFLPNLWPPGLAIFVLAFLMGYSYTKRFTVLSHLWLGAALMLAPVCAWVAIRGQWLTGAPWDAGPALVVGLAVLFWVTGFDIIYACQDADFDRRHALFSIPGAFGIPWALRLAAGCHAVMVALLVALPRLCPQVPLGWIYDAGVACISGLLVYEHLLVRPDDLTRVNRAFFHVNAVLSVGLCLVVLVDLLT